MALSSFSYRTEYGSFHLGQDDGLRSAYNTLQKCGVSFSLNSDPDLVPVEGGKCHTVARWSLRGYESILKPWFIRQRTDNSGILHYEPAAINPDTGKMNSFALHGKTLSETTINTGELHSKILDPEIPFVEGFYNFGEQPLTERYRPGSVGIIVFTLQDPELFFSRMDDMYDRNDRWGSVIDMAEETAQ